jgi:hypothetical protein
MPTCRSCGARITWLKTPGGKAIPVDEDPTDDGNILIDVEHCRLVARVYGNAEAAREAGAEELRYRSHFVTCPQAGEWRRREGGCLSGQGCILCR